MLVATLLVACTPASGPAAVAGAAQEPLWRYEVNASSSVDLDVTAILEGPITGPLRVDEAAMPFIRDVSIDGRGLLSSSIRSAAVCPASPCRLHYTMALGKAATQLADVNTAFVAGGLTLAPPSTWLLHPDAPSERGRYRVRVVSQDGRGFATGLRPSPGGAPNSWEASVDSLEEAAFSAFGPARTYPIAGSGAVVVIASSLQFDDAKVVAWVRSDVDAVTRYLGHAPDDRVTIFVVPGTQAVTRGETLGGGGASVMVRLGTSVTAASVIEDWVVAHELVHVGFPALAYEHTWFAEGLATYVEPLARVRAGMITPEKVWGDLVDGLPQGIPEDGDTGLEGSHDWGRVYWGGALYFLLADVEIREQTRGAKSLDDAIRAVSRGANVETHRSLEWVLNVADRATGTHVLHELFERFGRAPGAENLPKLWANLGVRKDGVDVRFDPLAPLAWVRTAVTLTGPDRK